MRLAILVLLLPFLVPVMLVGWLTLSHDGLPKQAAGTAPAMAVAASATGIPLTFVVTRTD